MRIWELWFFRRFSSALVLKAFLASFLASFRSRATLQFEVLTLRQQARILQRSPKTRPELMGSKSHPLGVAIRVAVAKTESANRPS